MEDDLLQFLRSRQIPNKDIVRMEKEKVDKSVLLIMSDQQMAHYLPSYGDRIATLSFCRQPNISTEKDTLLQRIREKIGNRKIKSRSTTTCSASNASSSHNDKERRGQPHESRWSRNTSRKIEIGWLNYVNNGYQQVRTPNGGGTRHASVEKSTTVEAVLELGKTLFFPNGISTKGHVSDFTFTICDFKINPIPMEDTVGQMYEKTKLKMLRFYLCSKETLSDESSFEENVAEDFLPDVFLDDEKTNSLSAAHDTCSDFDGPNTSVTDQRSSSDSDTREQILDFSKPSKRLRTVVDRHSYALQHSTPTHDEQECSETSDLLEMDDTVEWIPGDGTWRTDEDDMVVILDRDHQTDMSKLSELPLQILYGQQSPCDDLKPIEEQPHQTVEEDSGQLYEMPSHTSSHPSPSTSSDVLQLQDNKLRVHIRRIKVIDDLLAVFMNNNIMNINLKMRVVNENAVDDDGVSRDIYTAFWEQFLEYCEGENERVPRLRPDFGDAEWQAVGRIWVKGLLDHGVMPVQLCKAFILACIHGMDSVDQNTLMSSFLNYLPLVERAAIESALQGTIDESNKDDLLDLFTRMGSHSLPTNNNFKEAIETMAHKAILQEPKYVIDCFSTPMEQALKKLPDKLSVMLLYETKQPSGKRVAQLLKTFTEMSQREQTTFYHLQRYVKSLDQAKAGKMLRYCTGSSVLCVEKITVCFNAETGLNRRPIGHTCGATLEVPCTYSSYPEFRTEFDHILASDYFEMDIL